jgi:diguanylate cyclase (GGDEF)-like protein
MGTLTGAKRTWGSTHMGQKLTEQLAALTALTEVDRVILESPGIERILDTLMNSIRAVVGCDSAAIMLIDAADTLNARLYIDADAAHTHSIERVALPEGYAVDAVSGIFDLEGATLLHPYAASLARHGMQRMFMQPVSGSNDMAAVLALGLRPDSELSEEQREMARAYADRLSAALTNLEREQRLYQQAYYDPLTGLANRQLFRDRLDHELVRAGRSGEQLGLLYVDLDQFKHINDTLGHGAGDELLRVVAHRLRSVLKDTDTVARLGGDEFVIVLPQLANPEAAGRIAERVMTELAGPVRLRKREMHVSASIGVAISPQDGRLPEELIKNADTAMYRAKRRGRNRVLFYEAFMNTRVMERTSLETGLFHALQARQFILHYQPQVELRGGALSGAEALIRWNAPDRGQRSPAEFMPAAEESGLIVEISNWALNETCRQYTEWRQQGLAPPRLALNMSAEQLRHREFLDGVRSALLRWDVPPWALEFEFPESILLGDFERTGGILSALAGIGVRLAVDNFGTSLCSLSCLRHYPLQSVKIDRSFVSGLPNDSESGQVVAAILGMAKSLGKHTIAEGVENEAQAGYLESLGCDFAQGFLFTKALSAEDFLLYLKARQAEQDEKSNVESIRQAR